MTLIFSVPFHNAKLVKLSMNAGLFGGLRIIKIYPSLMDPVGQIVLNRDEINQNSFAELCSCYKMSWASPAAAGEK